MNENEDRILLEIYGKVESILSTVEAIEDKIEAVKDRVNRLEQRVEKLESGQGRIRERLAWAAGAAGLLLGLVSMFQDRIAAMLF